MNGQDEHSTFADLLAAATNSGVSMDDSSNVIPDFMAITQALTPEVKPTPTRKRRTNNNATTNPNGTTAKPKTDLILPRAIVELSKDVLQSYCDNVNKRCLLCCEKYDTDRIYSVRRHLFRKHRNALDEEVARAQHNTEISTSNGVVAPGNTSASNLQSFQGTLVNYVRSQSAFDILMINLFSTMPLPLSLNENQYFKRLLRMIPGFDPPTSITFRGQLVADNYRIIVSAANAANFNHFCAVSSGIAIDPYTLTYYIGIILHYYDYTSRTFKNAALSLVAMDKALSSEELETNIFDKLWEYQITPQKLIRNVMGFQFGLEKEIFSIDKALTEPEEYPLVNEENEDIAMPHQYPFDPSLLFDYELPEVLLTSNGLHCISYRLELTMISAFNKLPELVELKKAILSFLEIFSQSSTAFQELRNYTRVKILFPTSNSWPSMFATFKRILFAFDGIKQICENNKWGKFDDSVKDQLQSVIDLFEPILKFRKAVQVDGQPTISLVHSGIHGLVDLCMANTTFPEFAEAIQSELTSRFPDVLDPETADPIYLAAAALDPRTFELVCKEDATKDAIYKVLRNFGFEEIHELSPTANEKEIPVASSIFGFDIPSAKKIKVDKKPSRTISQISSYLNKIEDGEFYNCPVEAGQFWNFNKDFPMLGKLAFNLLCIPATSVNVEKLFGKLQLFTNSGKATTVDEMYETRAMLAFNNHVTSG